MKARIVPGSNLTPEMRAAVTEFAKAEVARLRKADLMKSIEVFVLADACVHRLEDRYGKYRLSRHLSRMMNFYEYLGGYDDSAKWKCIQILEDAGIDWREFFPEGKEWTV